MKERQMAFIPHPSAFILHPSSFRLPPAFLIRLRRSSEESNRRARLPKRSPTRGWSRSSEAAAWAKRASPSEVAGERASEFADGVAFVRWPPSPNPPCCPPSSRRPWGFARKVSGTGLSPPGAHRMALTHEVLLVLDNCEHLVEEAASLSQTLLGRCPDLHILTTSRQRLGLTGEIAWRVPSLPCPDPEDFGFWILDFGLSDPGQPIQNPKSKNPNSRAGLPAVQLFVERAAMARPGFPPERTARRGGGRPDLLAAGRNPFGNRAGRRARERVEHRADRFRVWGTAFDCSPAAPGRSFPASRRCER